MKTRTITQAAILLAIGTILHLIPGFVSMAKPDFMLVCVFTIILANKDMKTTLAISVAGGLLAGLTSNAPGGFIPNFIDKIVASLAVYFLSKLVKDGGLGELFTKGVLYFIGTVISGFIFLFLMDITGALPEALGLMSMLVILVLPTALINIVVGLFFDKIVTLYNKRIW